ncbi:MAG: heme NO-binding domain-containing protein [Planctomycetota bacterium]
MKGLIFTEFLAFLREQGGESLAEGIIEAAGVEGTYSGVGTYDVGELEALVGSACERLDLTRDQGLRMFGEWVFSSLAASYGTMLEHISGTFDLLRVLDRVIHVEVRKLDHLAELPSFDVLVDTPDRMELHYSSTRRMSALALGLMRGCIAYFGEELDATIISTSEDGQEATFVVQRKAA